ncbi:MAG TPA: DNA ligase D [Coriobacteriia bacterium]|nr:DNA ligase D [Coriobacteriia bacterium]
MGTLDEYRRKRDFGVTPEPSGEAGADHAGLSYVIQKHASSRLHWDFRIELDGVLLSWAIPKGPSLDTADKRLAMHVEDHPIAYGSFEGVIPKGEYGGGTVMLWDRGTWEPDHGDPRAHLAEGHLKFYLYGERLRGRWMLVRSKGYGGSGKDSWLLFKERDDEVRPKSEFDAVAEWTTSVATGRTMDEIAADVEAVWHSDASVEANVAGSTGIHPPPAPPAVAPPSLDAVEGARVAPFPRTVEVELAQLVKDVPEGERWIHEIKFDGYRIVALMNEGKVRLVSRNGKDWTDRFPAIVSAIAALPAKQAVLDGEVVVVRPDGTNDFQALQNFARRREAADLHYMVFDLLYLDGYDLRGAGLVKRKELLAPLLPRHADRLLYTDHIEGHGDTFFNKACDLSLEGVVSKRADAPYRPGRGRDWVKVKCLLRQEFVVVGFTDPGGSRKSFGALVIGVHEDGEIKQVGRVGTGFTEQSLSDIHARLIKIQRAEPPVKNPPKGALARSIHWVEPSLVAEVAFAEWTEEEQLRHPSFLGLREDKAADEVVVESPAPPPTLPPEPATKKGEGPVIATVRLSNPDRVLWPDVGVTKLELARYYESVADLMLPHVEERPLSLVRCPTGYTGECFYQKHIVNFPKAVATVDIYEPVDDETVPYARVTGLPSLVGLTQMGVLEIHPWGSRADDPEKPDRLIFDLDPDPELPWTTVAATASLIHVELERLGLKSWLKTTGGKGLHIVAPVTRRQSWGEVRDFARAFVESIVAIEPRLFTASMSKSQRGGKIFIDYVRNTRGSTAIAAYGSRARPGAPVSVPLYWSELDDMTVQPIFTVRNLNKRLSELSGDPWSELSGERQSITKAMRERLGIQ